MARTWTAIDFETANSDRGSVCAVGVVRVSGGRIVERFTSLVRPPEPVGYFSAHNTRVHGITAAHVREAPTWPQVLEQVQQVAAGSALVAHNAAFDIAVLRRACAYSGLPWSRWEYLCTLALARRTWRDLGDHRLPTVCSRIGHALVAHHRADADAEAAARITLAAMASYGTDSLADLGRAAGIGLGLLEAGREAVPQVPVAPAPAGERFARWEQAARAQVPAPEAGADPHGPLYGRTVCVTGELEPMDKPEAWRRIAEAGGQPAKNVTKKTDILVVADSAAQTVSAKQRRAQDYRARGQRIQIIGEAQFLAWVALTPS